MIHCVCVCVQVLRLETRVKAKETVDSEGGEGASNTEAGEEEEADPRRRTFWTKRAILDVRHLFLCLGL